jgi:hypothetical protein
MAKRAHTAEPDQERERRSRTASAARRTPIRVLFIASAGRSGSTLLDRVIGMQDGFCSVGELRFIWERAFAGNQLCGCGTPFHDCEFWRGVSQEVFGRAPAQADVSAAIRMRRSLDEIRYAPWLVQPLSPRAHRLGLRSYGQLLEHLYGAILDASGATTIVDSSGDATHGLILSRLPGVELDVVHLVRDARAVAFSWQRVQRRPEIHWTHEDMPIERVRTSARRWLQHNALAERLSSSAHRYRRLRYEDFVADPQSTLRGLLAPYAWMHGGLRDVTEADVVLKPTHTVSGNPMRFKQGRLTIKLDDEWRRGMADRDRRSVTAITWPLLLRYGYPLRRRAAAH